MCSGLWSLMRVGRVTLRNVDLCPMVMGDGCQV